jgi:hypothetical protein
MSTKHRRRVDPRWASFKSGFKEARTGSLWQKYRDVTVSIFSNRHGAGYCWSIASAGGAIRWSPCSFDSERAAMKSLAHVLGVRKDD